MVLILRESWELTNGVTLKLLEKIPEHHLSVKASTGGRNIGAKFAHINNVRVQWLNAIGGVHSIGLIRLEKDDYTYKTKILEALKISSDRIGGLVETSVRTDMKVKGYPKGINSFLFYLVSHEAHHRGEIILSLKSVNLNLESEFLFSLWDF